MKGSVSWSVSATRQGEKQTNYEKKLGIMVEPLVHGKGTEMPDIDSNGVDILDRLLAFKYRFMQFSVTEDVFNQVVDYIKELRRERDEARFAAAYQYAKHHNGDVQTLMDNFCELKGWQKFQFFVGDDDHAKMEADSNNKLFRNTDMK
jgi:hypothetical protein